MSRRVQEAFSTEYHRIRLQTRDPGLQIPLGQCPVPCTYYHIMAGDSRSRQPVLNIAEDVPITPEDRISLLDYRQHTEGPLMNWRDDSTATNVSLLSKWVYGVLRPIVRILRSAGVSEASLLEGVKRASAQHDGDTKKGRLGSGSRYESLLALGSVTGAWARSSA